MKYTAFASFISYNELNQISLPDSNFSIVFRNWIPYRFSFEAFNNHEITTVTTVVQFLLHLITRWISQLESNFRTVFSDYSSFLWSPLVIKLSEWQLLYDECCAMYLYKLSHVVHLTTRNRPQRVSLPDSTLPKIVSNQVPYRSSSRIAIVKLSSQRLLYNKLYDVLSSICVGYIL